jgi:glutathione synthase/RimK-type ligase-like ATP-grasp enzyme
MKVFLLPHGPSNGCTELARAIGALRIRREKSRFKPSFNKLVVNWGVSRTDCANPHWINSPQAIALASNKLDALWAMHDKGVPVPEFTSSPDEATGWLDAGETVFARTTLRGSSGAGIVVMQSRDDMVRANLYTKYFKAFDEYRVHVFDGKVIDVQQKRKREDVPKEEANFMVRSHDNGFNFCRDGVDIPDACLEAAVAAVAALGLDFGAVDLRYNQKKEQPCVLEVNTAPGLEGTTVEKYSQAITELLERIGV